MAVLGFDHPAHHSTEYKIVVMTCQQDLSRSLNSYLSRPSMDIEKTPQGPTDDVVEGDLKAFQAKGDLALQVYAFDVTAAELAQVDAKKLVRKIDLHLIPVVSVLQARSRPLNTDRNIYEDDSGDDAFHDGQEHAELFIHHGHSKRYALDL